MSHQHDIQCKCKSTVAVQSPDEMDFERGIWSAALYNDFNKLDKCIAIGQTNKVDSTGYSALHYAARNGHLAVCEKLLDAGANVNAITRSGNVTPLMRAALMGHDEIVRLLLRRGANIFYKDNDGNTALHKAAQNRHFHVTKLILQLSAGEQNRLESIYNNRGETAQDLSKH